jgi:hypothetical protein
MLKLKLPPSIPPLTQTRTLLLIKAIPTATLGGACGLDTADPTATSLYAAETASRLVGTVAGSCSHPFVGTIAGSSSHPFVGTESSSCSHPFVGTESSSLVHAAPPLLAGQVGGAGEEGFLAGDVPVVLFGADGEFEVFFGDGVPVLSQNGISVVDG